MDFRGHARSAGPRVAPDPWMVYVEDMDQLVGIVAAAEPGRPIFLFGHSMGGAVAALEVVEHPGRIAGLILSAPVLNLGVPPFVVAAVRMLGVVAPSLGVMTLDATSFSHDPAVAAAMVEDPLVEQGAGPARTAAGLADATARIFAGRDRLTLPILALHGTADQLTAPSGSSRADRARAVEPTRRCASTPASRTTSCTSPTARRSRTTSSRGSPRTPADPRSRRRRSNPARCAVIPRAASPRSELGGGAVGATHDVGGTASGLFEMSLHLGKGAPIGWAGGLTLRAAGNGFEAALLPIGANLRFGGGGLGVATGVSTIPGGLNVAIPAAGWLELPLGPIHATLDGRLDYRVAGDPPRAGALASDLAEVGLALRLFGDREVWPRAFAGAGPYVRGAILDAGGATAVLVTIGIALYGSD